MVGGSVTFKPFFLPSLPPRVKRNCTYIFECMGVVRVNNLGWRCFVMDDTYCCEKFNAKFVCAVKCCGIGTGVERQRVIMGTKKGRIW